jgi:hypothetical protein
MKRRRSSITEHSFHGINTSRAGGPAQQVSPMCPEQTVTHVSERSGPAPLRHNTIPRSSGETDE